MSTTIEWTDKTWNPTVGCSRVSAGCDHCYAMGVAHRAMQPAHEGLTKLRPKDAARPGVDWTGEVRLLPERLGEPLRWRKPARVFVDSMSDLFHPSVPFEFVAAVLGVMAATPHLTYQVLTKRPERAREFFAHTFGLESAEETIAREAESRGVIWDSRARDIHLYPMMPSNIEQRRAWVWPLPNVWLGTSVEEQASADRRIPELLQCPAALRFVSYEPALGPVDFDYAIDSRERDIDHRKPEDGPWFSVPVGVTLDWIIVGGESGAKARYFDIRWARSVIQQTRGTGCRVFVKQLGKMPHAGDACGWKYGILPRRKKRRAWWRFDERAPDGSPRSYRITSAKGKAMHEWPADLRVREMPEAA